MSGESSSVNASPTVATWTASPNKNRPCGCWRGVKNGPGGDDTEAVRIGFSPRKLFWEMLRVVPGCVEFYSGRPVMFSHDGGS